MNRFVAWSSRQTPWKLGAFVFFIYGLALLEYFDQDSVILAAINASAVIFTLAKLFLKK